MSGKLNHYSNSSQVIFVKNDIHELFSLSLVGHLEPYLTQRKLSRSLSHKKMFFVELTFDIVNCRLNADYHIYRSSQSYSYSRRGRTAILGAGRSLNPRFAPTLIYYNNRVAPLAFIVHAGCQRTRTCTYNNSVHQQAQLHKH
jgi:hypothetical protein